jgi:CRISPR-associated endonuclease/helicase Cas3
VLKTNFKVKSSLLLKHHHLSDKSYDEYEFSVSRILSEGWNSEIVITTFIQLFHTLLSWKNSNSRRFNKLAGSILLIDEVQSLPHKYWHLLRNLLKEVSDKLDTYIILMTATQPYLLEDAEELIQRDKYFKKLDRVRFHINLEPQTISEFVEGLELEKDKSYLFIANTVASSKDLYQKIKEKFQEKVCYLSTHIVPYERKRRIEEIKNGNFRIAVTTQLVEAGVDIDFDVVYRDFAPLDSLSQSAGRCNRNMEKEKGEFFLINLVNEKNKPYYSSIYDPVLCLITEEILKGKKIFSEPEFTALVEDYFREVWNRISPDISKKIEEAVKCFLFSGEQVDNKLYISDFKLIEDEVYKEDVFIELNECAQKVWKKARRIMESLRTKEIDLFKAKEEFEKLKPEFYSFVVSVNVKKNTPPFDEELKIYYIGNNVLENYYDLETGFIADGEDFYSWI